MKQCPACKNTYTDATLKYCLTDGTPLVPLSFADEPTIAMSGDQSPSFVTAARAAAAPPADSNPTVQIKKSRRAPLMLAAVAVVLLTLLSAVAAVVLLNPFGKKAAAGDGANISNKPGAAINANSPAGNAVTADAADQNSDLEKKVAALEKQLKEQANRKNPFNNAVPATGSATPNTSKVPTARVAPTSDGFLSLRTEPNVKTGTQLVKIPSGATVNLENCEKNQTTVDGRRGRWCMVSYAGETGWAFDAFLVY